MKLPMDLLERTSQEAAHRIARGLLDAVHAAAPRLQDPEDEDALHDFRVAIRRLRSAFSAWRAQLRGSIAKRHRRALRALQVATGTGRDAEVAAAWLRERADDVDPALRDAVRGVAAEIEGRGAHVMAQVRGRVPTEFYELETRLRKRLAAMSVLLDDEEKRPPFAAVLAEKVRAHGDDLAAHLARVASVDHRAEAHVARIRCKRLRYLLEPLRESVRGASQVVNRCKQLQDLLGDFNDAFVLGDLLAESGTGAGTTEIRRLAGERRERLFARLRDEWMAGGRRDLEAAVEKTVRHCLKAAGPRREIERKYLLRGMPTDMPAASVVEIDQGWLPGRVLRERIRRIRSGEGTFQFRTVKLGSGLERIEIEEDTTAEVFTALWPLTEGCRVRKRRHLVEFGDHTWEVDEFLDRDLVLAEVELASTDEEAAPPPWIAAVLDREVTEEPQFTNLALAR